MQGTPFVMCLHFSPVSTGKPTGSPMIFLYEVTQ